MSYASRTQVPVDRSKTEIERILMRYGAGRFGYNSEPGRAVIMFQMNNRAIKFILPLPLPPAEDASWRDIQTFDQIQRQRWRALTLIIKAKLEAVNSDIMEFEREFLAHIVLPNGKTVGEWIEPQLDMAYKDKKMPPMLAWEK